MIEIKIFFTNWRDRIASLRELAPYAAIEILLPGGSLVALILWLVRRRLKKRLIAVPYAAI